MPFVLMLVLSQEIYPYWIASAPNPSRTPTRVTRAHIRRREGHNEILRLVYLSAPDVYVATAVPLTADSSRSSFASSDALNNPEGPAGATSVNGGS